MKKVLATLILLSHVSTADEGVFEKSQNFRSVAYGTPDETCAIVSEDINAQMNEAEEKIQKMNGIVISKMTDPCIFADEMQTSITGEIVYLIEDSAEAIE